MNNMIRKNDGAEALAAKMERRGRSLRFTAGLVLRIFVILLLLTATLWAALNSSLAAVVHDLRQIAKAPLELRQGQLILSFPWNEFARFLPKALGFSFMAALAYTFFAIRKAREDMGADFNEDYREITEDELFDDYEKWWRRTRKKFEAISQEKDDFFARNDRGALDGDALNALKYGQYLTISKNLTMIPETLLKSHIGASGATRTGKTTLIKDLIPQIRFYGHQAFILDYNGELYKTFGQPGDTVLCPFDKRTARYDLFSEPVTPDKIAAGLVAHDVKNPFFSNNGRKLLTSLMQMSRSHEDLWDLILKDQEELKAQLLAKKIDTGKLFENHKTAGDVITTMQTNLGLLPYLNHWNQRSRPFSIVNWAKHSLRGFVFVIVPDSMIEPLSPWMRLYFEMAITGALERNPDERNTPLYLIADEIKQLGHLQSFEKAVTNGAKYNLRLVVGWQIDSQLEVDYGAAQAKSILGNIRTRGIFNPGNDPHAVKEASELLGATDVIEMYVSETRNGEGSSVNISAQEKRKNVVPEAKLKSLEELDFYLKLPFQRPVKLQARPHDFKARNVAMEKAVPSEIMLGGRA